jgi:hypothetical protein
LFINGRKNIYAVLPSKVSEANGINLSRNFASSLGIALSEMSSARGHC